MHAEVTLALWQASGERGESEQSPS